MINQWATFMKEISDQQTDVLRTELTAMNTCLISAITDLAKSNVISLLFIKLKKEKVCG